MEDNLNQENSSQELKKDSPVKKYLRLAWDFLAIIIVAALIVVPIRYFLFQPFIVKGESMVPNFHDKDYLIVDELSYRIWQPQRGDVVILDFPLDESQKFIKRIIGLPGETVKIKNNIIKIFRDGQEMIIDEKQYLPNVVTDGDIAVTLGEDEYFVLGDNREFSFDSRRWFDLNGKPITLKKSEIVGKAFIRLYPFSDISVIKTPTY